MSLSYQGSTPLSKKLFERATKVFAGGVNHNARYYEPYPISVKRAKGQHVWDEDGNRYVDFWMGHMALILGHSPKLVTDALQEQIKSGTHYGMGSRLSLDLGEEIQRSVPCAEMLRFCNTGAEATMYLVRLARAYSRRKTVIKIAGGWHGYNTDLNKGVHKPFNQSESEGILPEEQAHVRLVKFNDLSAAEKTVKNFKGDVAVILVEPVLGAGGCIPGTTQYLKGIRELADREGVILAFDEIITGFRLALGGAQEWYRVKPDLAALGKVAGGGLPLGVVCGLKEMISLASPLKKGAFASIGGGTFSENPLTMTAGLATTRHLRKNKDEIYPSLQSEGEKLRTRVDNAFDAEGIETNTTGAGSLFLTHFGPRPMNAEAAENEDKELTHKYAINMMSHGIFVLPRHPGAISTAHEQSDMDMFVEIAREFASEVASKRKRKEKVAV